jgi:peptidoglycan-N-acetylglucosamine deacetylase
MSSSFSPQRQLLAQLARRFPDAVFYKETTERVVALTIDDVPTPNEADDASTHCILAAIAHHNQMIDDPQERVRATFFIITSHLNQNTTILREMVQQGHEIANHGIADDTTAFEHPEIFSLQLSASHQRLSEFCDQPIRWYRPGRGLYNQAMVKALRQMKGYEPRFALASMLPVDTFTPTNNPDFTIRYVSQFIFPGAILLLHGGSVATCGNTAIAIQSILKLLQAQNYRVVTLSELWAR